MGMSDMLQSFLQKSPTLSSISHSPHALAWGSAPNVFRSNRFNGLPAAKI